MSDNRAHDIILFGATGFTGALTTRYLVAHAPSGCRIALAGRNMAKLEAVRAELAALSPEHADIPLLRADSGDAESLHRVAAATRVVITTVGPYLEYGEPLVAACADAGTDYVDLCGEPEFVDVMFTKHHDRAVRTGARLVHACGFDSIPYDLGVLYTVRHLPTDVPLSVEGQISASATLSGGTFGSALGAFSRFNEMRHAAAERRKADPRPAGRRIRTPGGTPHRDAGTGRWQIPMPTIDPMIVGRSATALSSYGPEFTYRQFASVKRLPTVAIAGVGLAALFVAAQIPLTRNAIGKLRKAGDGPSEEQRERSWFTFRAVGEGGGKRVVTEVSGGDPGYGETAKMLSESALCLAFDELPATAGQVTTATAMGDALITRLSEAGIIFRVVS